MKIKARTHIKAEAQTRLHVFSLPTSTRPICLLRADNEPAQATAEVSLTPSPPFKVFLTLPSNRFDVAGRAQLKLGSNGEKL